MIPPRVAAIEVPVVEKVRRRAGGAAIAAMVEGLAAVGRLHPTARRRLENLEIEEDVQYGPDIEAHRLDVWRPKSAGPDTAAVLFVHGGGFRVLSKNTHWLMAMLYAEAGYIVFTINYRLAPTHPFPAALEDTCLAYRWVLANGRNFGADPENLAIAGESAGANLLLSLTVATCFERPEPFARAILETGVVPRAVLPACGILQVSDPNRFDVRPLPGLVRERIQEVSRGYLGGRTHPTQDKALADPLLILEGEAEPVRAFPPSYLCVGTHDPIQDDTHRLAEALARRGIPHELDVFAKQPHAFHALIWRDAAQRCWEAQRQFLAKHLQPKDEPVSANSDTDSMEIPPASISA